MKKRLTIIVATVLALVLALFALTACNNETTKLDTELVNNGDFSKVTDAGSNTITFDGWTTSSSSVKFNRREDGDNAYLYLSNSSKTYSYLKQSVYVDSNKIYKVSVDIRVFNTNKLTDYGAYVTFLENTGYKFASHTQNTNGFVTEVFYVQPKGTDYLTIALCLGNEDNGSTGDVAFDNVSIQRVEKSAVPSGTKITQFRKAKSVVKSTTASGIAFVVCLVLFTAALFAGIYLVVKRLYSRREAFVSFDAPVSGGSSKGSAKGKNFVKNTFFIAAILALVTLAIRFIILFTTYGMGTSMTKIITDAKFLGAKNGVSSFYAKNTSSTLAPGAMYILAILGAITSNNGTLSILIRLINILADVAVVLMIYFYGKKYVGNRLSTIYAAVYAVLPFAFTMSGFNGTFESLLVALMLASVILMVEKQYLPTYLMMTLATVLDLRAMAIAPIVVAYFVYRYIKDDAKLSKFTSHRAMIIFGLVASFVLGYLLTLPVAIDQIKAGNAFFNFQMMAAQITKNTSFVVNAFNLYGMATMNGKTITQQGIGILNLIFLLVLEAYSISLYFKNKNKQELLLIISFTLAVIAVFTVKVDFTYLFLSIAFALIYTMVSGDKRMYWITAGLSTLGFLNIAQLLNQSGMIGGANTLAVLGFESQDPFYIVFSVITVLVMAYYVYVTYSITNNTKIVDIAPLDKPLHVAIKDAVKSLKLQREAKKNAKNNA